MPFVTPGGRPRSCYTVISRVFWHHYFIILCFCYLHCRLTNLSCSANSRFLQCANTNANGKCIIVLFILLTISTQLIKYLLATLTGTVDGGWMGGVDGGMASGGSGKFEVCGGS